jgi:nucleoside-diphosphate-sugar epimerase
MKIFLTGGTGFIGMSLLKKLLSKKYTVVALVRNSENAEILKMLGAEPVIGDISQPKTFQEKLKNCDVVIHLAAIRANWGDSNEFIRINSLAIKNLFVSNSKIKHVIVTSSVYAMGTLKELPANELHVLNAKDIYGKTKIMAENITKKSSSTTNIPYTIIRPAIVYGPNDNEMAFMSKFVTLTRKKKLPKIGSGNNLLHLVHIDDLVNGYLNAVESKANNQTYILASKNPISFNELLKMVKKELKSDFKPIRIPKFIIYPIAYFITSIFKIGFVISPKFFANEPPITPLKISTLFENWHYDISKAENELKYKPIVDYKNGVRDVVVKN